MEPKELHVVSTGNSLIQHYVRSLGTEPRPRMGDEDFWRQVLDSPAELDRLAEFLRADPPGRSAEVRSLEAYLRAHGRGPADVALYLIGTRTASNEIVRTTLTRYFKALGYEIYQPEGVSGYFGEPDRSAEAFRRGMVELLQGLVDIVDQARRRYAAVVFNPTGGFKAHVIVVALAAFITGCPVYYIHEEFQDLIEFPPLFYLPTVEELNFLKGHGQAGFDPGVVPDEGWLRRWIDFGVVAWGPDGRLRVTSRAQAFFSPHPLSPRSYGEPPHD